MKKYLESLARINDQIDADNPGPSTVIMPPEQLRKLRLCKHLRHDINELIYCYSTEMKYDR